MQSLVTTRVQQVIIEDQFSRRNIQEKVRQDVLATKDIKKPFKKCKKLLKKYLKEEYYESKQARVNHLVLTPIEEIMAEIFIATLPCDDSTPVQAIVDKLAKWLDYDDIFDGVKTAAELLAVCADADLYDMDTNPITITSLYSLSQETLDFIERTRVVDPMITTPDPWTSNHNGGYITLCESVILGKGNHHEEHQALDALNLLQKVELELDQEVLLQNEPGKDLDTLEKQEAHELMSRVSESVYDAMLETGNKFYFVWKYDFRGRAYSSGYYINLQSTAYKKALLNTTHKRLIK